MTFEELRGSYSKFIYKDYRVSIVKGECLVEYFYEIPGVSEFTTKWVFPASRNLNTPILRRYVFCLGLAEAISYYKCVCPRTVKIECGSLDDFEVRWWKKLFYHGLGEFMYKNNINIDYDKFVQFDCEKGIHPALRDTKKYFGVMVPVGGGKDSVVSLELLKEESVYTYSINANTTINNVIETCKHRKGDLRAKRELDPKIIELNEKGFLNGHIPFSAVVAFSSMITAYLNGMKYIALSNESSANESTIKGSFVNHQYSKSYEFERDFTQYIERISDSDIHYFSFLRPLSELGIAKLFARFEDYHEVFRSCNKGSKQGIWCCDCPKCLFVYIILTPFLDEYRVKALIGEKLLDKESLDQDFRELSGISENKPFECVGTRDEVMACLKVYVQSGKKSLLTDRYRDKILAANNDIDLLTDTLYREHNVPKRFYKYIIDSVMKFKSGFR